MTETSRQARSDRRHGDPPNVLWVFMDDVCPWMRCYGHDVVDTENIDALAAVVQRWGEEAVDDVYDRVK